MESLFLSLTKTKEYCLKPFGRFNISITHSIGTKRKQNVLDFGTLNTDESKAMPYNKEDEKSFEKFMLKHKTDVLVETGEYGNRTFYTRVGDRFVSISHYKLKMYCEFLKQRELEDDEESWKQYIQ